jgi:hypothetical protein
MSKENTVPLWERPILTFPEASQLFGIGINRLRRMAMEPDCDYVIWIGQRKMIKRVKFNDYLMNSYSV